MKPIKIAESARAGRCKNAEQKMTLEKCNLQGDCTSPTLKKKKIIILKKKNKKNQREQNSIHVES